MTTTVIVLPHGHNADAIITTLSNGELIQQVVKLDPHAETRFEVYADRTVTIRETGGWAEKPPHPGDVLIAAVKPSAPL